MNWPHYRVVVARVGALAFGLLVVFLIGTALEQANEISDLTRRLANAENQRALDERAFRADQERTNAERQGVMLDGIRALQGAIGTRPAPEVQAAVNELLARVRTQSSSGSPGPPGPQGTQGTPGPAGPPGAAVATTSTVPATTTSTTRQTTTTTSPRASTTTTRCTVGIGALLKLGCR